MGHERLFAYGTLNDPAKQTELFGARFVGAADALDGYATIDISDDGEKFLAAVPQEDASIEGYVFDLSEEDLKAADVWEGDAYHRKILKLRSGASAWVYVKK
jgi:gamma-glutamylcyclotransferase (GGCT)/AIG2-like uncharacterized protein YtfP